MRARKSPRVIGGGGVSVSGGKSPVKQAAVKLSCVLDVVEAVTSAHRGTPSHVCQMKHGHLNQLFAGLRGVRLESATRGGEVLGFAALKSEAVHGWLARGCGSGFPSPVSIMYTVDNAPTHQQCDALRIVTFAFYILPFAQFPHSLGFCCQAFWGFAGTHATQLAMGSGVAPGAVLARDSPAAWYQALIALAIEALA